MSTSETRLMSLSSIIYLINYVFVIFFVHSPLTGADLMVSRNDADALYP